MYLLRELVNLALGGCKRRISYETAGNLELTQYDAFSFLDRYYAKLHNYWP